MPKPAVSGCPSTRGRIFLSVVSYVAKRKKGLASWRSPFCFSGTNAPVDVVTLFQPTPPARGTTGGDHLPIPQYHISIHAPARGATLRVHDSESQGENFNPPPREGGDYGGYWHQPLSGISIHAPLQGGRRIRPTARIRPKIFQSTPPRGGRLKEGRTIGLTFKFQSTPPIRGGRRWASPAPANRSAYFNPRPPRGGATAETAKISSCFYNNQIIF